jgi:hypothetical protein
MITFCCTLDIDVNEFMYVKPKPATFNIGEQVVEFGRQMVAVPLIQHKQPKMIINSDIILRKNLFEQDIFVYRTAFTYTTIGLDLINKLGFVYAYHLCSQLLR